MEVLVEVLDRLGQVAGLRILVDWHDVAAAGWNPAGEGKLVVSNLSPNRVLAVSGSSTG